MGDLLAFRKMITPTIIQVIFWVGLVGIVIIGIMMMVYGGRQ